LTGYFPGIDKLQVMMTVFLRSFGKLSYCKLICLGALKQ